MAAEAKLLLGVNPSFGVWVPRRIHLGLGGQLPSILSILLFCLCSYCATLCIKLFPADSQPNGVQFAFFRFLLGAFLYLGFHNFRGQKLVIKEWPYLVGRAIFNASAVSCFYISIVAISLPKATILNMTAPVYVAIFAFVLNKPRKPAAILSAAIAVAGVIFCMQPVSLTHFSGSPDVTGILFGTLSGILAGASLFCLHRTREYNSAFSVLLCNYLIGSTVVGLCFPSVWTIASSTTLLFMLGSACFSLAGDFLLTVGMRGVSAELGSVLGCGRIVLAATFTPFIVNEPYIGLSGLFGIMLIVWANIRLGRASLRTNYSLARPGMASN